LDKLGVHMTPTLILVDSAGKVLDSWRGELQLDGEREVFAALGLPYKPKAGSTSTSANIKKTADIFAEQKAVLSIRPQTEPQNDPAHFVEVFDVNDRGDVYLASDKFMYKYDAQGTLKDAHPLPPEFKSPVCVDDSDNIYAAGARSLTVFSPELFKLRDVSLGERLPQDAFTLKLLLDHKRESLYMQIYVPEPLSQVLYRLDLKSQQVTEVYRLPKPVRFNPPTPPERSTSRYRRNFSTSLTSTITKSTCTRWRTAPWLRPLTDHTTRVRSSSRTDSSTSARCQLGDWAKAPGYATTRPSST
jgi:hypothetical protein